MNWNEIENTVLSLIERHPNLDDAMLKVLLLSGGWDEKMINEAVLVYHRIEGKNLFPKLENPPFLQPEVQTGNLLLEHFEDEKKVEPQSLISPSIGTILSSKNSDKKEVEPPHDLPLRPFESSTHVWPFARYKDVFYGDVMPTHLTVEEKQLAKKHKAENIYLAKIPMTKKEKDMLILVSSMLLVVLLLLGYMYSNGRL